MINRSGGVSSNVLLFLPLFLLLVLVGLGLVGMVYNAFGKGYDFRSSESQVLFGSVVECLQENQASLNLFLQDKDFFLSSCSFDKSVLEDGAHIIYLKKSSGEEMVVGVRDFIVRCDIEPDLGIVKSNLPECDKGSFGDIQILVGSNQNSFQGVS